MVLLRVARRARNILRHSKDFPAPILIVQHHGGRLHRWICEWLKNSASSLFMLQAGRIAAAGHVYVAPDEYQMKVGSDGKIVLTKESPSMVDAFDSYLSGRCYVYGWCH